MSVCGCVFVEREREEDVCIYTRVSIDSQQGAAMGVMVVAWFTLASFLFLFIDAEAADRRVLTTTKAATRRESIEHQIGVDIGIIFCDMSNSPDVPNANKK
jgi:hypothetical protein